MKERVRFPATGRNRSKIEPKLSCARFASMIIATISADVRPTASGVARCAATPQKARPNTAEPPAEIMRATAFWISRPERAPSLERHDELGAAPLFIAHLHSPGWTTPVTPWTGTARSAWPRPISHFLGARCLARGYARGHSTTAGWSLSDAARVSTAVLSREIVALQACRESNVFANRH